MENDKDKVNFRIHLTGNKYILGDGRQYYIVSETMRKTKKGELKPYRKNLSGYYSNFELLMQSYFDETIKHAEIDGELADLAKLFVKTRREIRGWFRMLGKVQKEDFDD